MRILKYIVTIIAIVLLSCQPENLPETPQENNKPDTEVPEGETPNNPDSPQEPENPNPEAPDNPGSTEPEPELPQEPYYIKVTQNFSDWSGDYIITYTSGSSVLALNSHSGTSGYGVEIGSKLTSQGIHSNDGDQYKAVVEKSGNGYTINVSGIGYLGLESSNNSVNASTSIPSSDNYRWSISYKDGGSVWISNLSKSNYRLQWNASANIFRCYKGSQKELTLYRRSISSGGSPGTTPDPTPDPDPTPEPDPEPDPTPDPDPEQPGETPTPTPGQSGKYGWYELPVINYSQSGSYMIDSKDNNLYYAHHMCAGGEKGPGGKTARNYTVCFSAEHHCPVWVAAPRHSMYSGSVKRTDAYGKDPSIPADIQYKKKDADSGCNNGHMLGSAERTSSKATNEQVFYFSNIAPQYQSTFNTGGGGWNTLEDWVDKQVCSDTLYVVIGAYFEEYTDRRGYTDSPAKISFGGRSDVGKPTMFYYILMRTKKGSSGKALKDCTASDIKCAAFVRSHKTPSGVAVSEKDLMSVSDLEKITGFTYFPNVPQAPKSSYNASDWGL